jgi:tetratricopeptide (TPR) repeat protein
MVVHAAFSPDGRRIVTASADYTARVWEAATGQPTSPPLKHEGYVYHAAFSPDGRRIVTASWDKTARVWDILSDDRNAGDLILLAHLSSGSRVETSGSLVPLTPKEFHDAWQALREKHPEDFVASDREVLAWHRREAEDCEAKRVWDWAIKHLDPLIASEPTSAGLYVRRADALTELGRLKEAAADDSKALELELPEDPEYWLKRGDACAKRSRWERAANAYSKAVDTMVGEPKREALVSLATVMLAKNDVGAYRKACADLLGHLNQNANFWDTEVTARTFVLAPNAVVDGEAVVNLVKRTANAQRTDTDRHLYLRTLGAATYRVGRYAEAVQHLDEGVKVHGKGGDPTDCLFLAMAHQRLGHTAEARRWLDKAINWIDSSTQDKPKDDSYGDQFGWQTWLALQVLRREAEALVKGSKPDAPPGRP